MATSPTSVSQARGVSRPVGMALTAAATVVAGLLLFWNLGFYPFWGDEADTVIFAQGVWRTGDTSAWYREDPHAENLYAYRGGTLLEHFKNRSVPPAAYYLVAPLYGLCGADHLALRAVFAVCALGVVALVGHWLHRAQASTSLTACVLAALVLNVSFVLNGRQCRYYALAMLLTTAIAYLYFYFDGTRLRLIALAACLWLLAATHYLHFAAVAGSLVVDYAVCGRKRYALSLRQWAAILLPTLVVVGLLAYVYDPIGKHTFATDVAEKPSYLVGRAKLLWWSLRDLNRCEYGVGIVMALAPIVAWWRRTPRLAQLFLACLTFTLVTVAFSPQPVGETLDADIRYLAPIIPACVVLTVWTIDLVFGGRAWLSVPLVALCVATNVLHVPWDRVKWRSTIGDFVNELREPRRVAGQVVADWLRANAPPGSSVWVTPGEYVAEQIVEAPHVVYGWQLEHDVDDPRRAADYRTLSTIHFAGQVPVDYIVAHGFGNLPKTQIDHVRDVVLPQMAERGFIYREAATLDVFFDDRTRPELIWHWFHDQPYDRNKRNIVVFALQKN